MLSPWTCEPSGPYGPHVGVAIDERRWAFGWITVFQRRRSASLQDTPSWTWLPTGPRAHHPDHALGGDRRHPRPGRSVLGLLGRQLVAGAHPGRGRRPSRVLDRPTTAGPVVRPREIRQPCGHRRGRLSGRTRHKILITSWCRASGMASTGRISCLRISRSSSVPSRGHRRPPWHHFNSRLPGLTSREGFGTFARESSLRRPARLLIDMPRSEGRTFGTPREARFVSANRVECTSGSDVDVQLCLQLVDRRELALATELLGEQHANALPV